MEVEHRAYARVGLLGNPSDVYGGRAVSFAVAGLWATVRLRPSEELLIQPHPRHDLVAFPCLSALVRSQSSTRRRSSGSSPGSRTGSRRSTVALFTWYGKFV
jgi:glucuronokinase